MPYLSRLNRTRLLQDKCRTLLNTTVRQEMKKITRVTIGVACILLVASIALVFWTYSRPIAVSASSGMTLADVRQSLEADDRWEYNFYSDPSWCTRGIFNLGEVFSYHTWIGFQTDDQGRVESARGYHAVTIELPVIGFHDYEFPSRPAVFSPQ